MMLRMDNTQGPRPTSWDAGATNDPCQTSDDRLWVGWWFRSENTAYFQRFDGATGTQLDEVVKPNWDVTNSKTYGPYGGATDADGNFWVTGLGGPLVKIDGLTLELTQWEVPPDAVPYGMTVDKNGHPWSAGLNGEFMHFDPANETFDVYPSGNGALRGMMIDREDQAWAAGNGPCALVQFDTITRTVVNANIPLAGCSTPVGVSIDIDGYVWVPDQGSNLAFKVHPQTYQLTTTQGLVQPYTYSDMTGAGLGLVAELEGPWDQEDPNHLVLGGIFEFQADRWFVAAVPTLVHAFGGDTEDGERRDDKWDFAYAAEIAYTFSEYWSLALEGYGTVERLGNTGHRSNAAELFGDFNQHRLGPAVYYQHHLGASSDKEERAGISIGFGLLEGMNHNTASHTLKLSIEVDF